MPRAKKTRIVEEMDDDFDPPGMSGGKPDQSKLQEIEQRISQEAEVVSSLGSNFRRLTLPGELPPSEMQWAIYERAMTTEDSFQISALAGTGKTTTGQGIVLRSGLGKKMLAIAFSKHNVKSFEEKMPQATNSTIHSLSFQTFKRQCRYLRWTKDSVDAESKKIKRIVADLKIDKQYPEYEEWEVQGMFHDLIHYQMVSMTPPVPEAIEAMADEFTVRIPGAIDLVAEHSQMILKKARELAFGQNGGIAYINFDEMIYYPAMEQMQFEQFHTVFVDEDQDLNDLQHEVLGLIPCVRRICVGDENQAIMMFAGAKNNSIECLKKRFSLDSLPLNLNYRCGKEIVRNAQKIVPALEFPEWQIEGEVKRIPRFDLQKSLTNGAFVLCRVNAPLVSLCFQLIQNGVRARIRGRDMSRMFGKLIRQIAGRDHDIGNFPTLLQYWLEKDLQRILSNGGRRAPLLAGNLRDKAECLMAFYDNLSPYTYDEFIRGIGVIFSDETTPGVNLMSGHASKGLEAEDVFVVHPDKLPLVWNGQSDAQFKQEVNLDYVIRTRGKKRHIYVEGDSDD